MGASSSHYGDVHRWVLKVIDSCNQNNQIFTAHRLVDNFCSRAFPDRGVGEMSLMVLFNVP